MPPSVKPLGKDGNNSAALVPGSDDRLAQEAIGQYQEACQIEALWQRAQNHIVEIATIAGLEVELRRHLEMIRQRIYEKSRAHLPEGKDEERLDYALAQSYMRTNEWANAKKLFLKIKLKNKENLLSSPFAIGSDYYLGQIEIAEHQATAEHQDTSGGQAEARLPEAAVKYFHQYLKASPNGHFAPEIVRRLLNAAKVTSSGEIEPAKTSISPEDRNLFGQVYFASGDWNDALEQWDCISNNNNLLPRAICYAHLGRMKEARDFLMQTVKNGCETYAGAAALLAAPLTRPQTIDLYKEILSLAPANQTSPCGISVAG